MRREYFGNSRAKVGYFLLVGVHAVFPLTFGGRDDRGIGLLDGVLNSFFYLVGYLFGSGLHRIYQVGFLHPTDGIALGGYCALLLIYGNQTAVVGGYDRLYAVLRLQIADNRIFDEERTECRGVAVLVVVQLP